MIPEIYHRAIKARRQGAIFDVTDTIGVLKISGDDRIVFLNNLITIDINTLSQDQGQEALILNPQAIIQFQFWLFLFPDSILLVLPLPHLNNLKEFLDGRVFTEKVALEALESPLYYFEKPDPSFPTLLPFSAQEVDNQTILRLDCSGDIGYLIWGDVHLQLLEETEVFFSLAYEGFNFHLVPPQGELPQKIAAMELPHWEKFFTFNKGCYPGQEIITRSQTRNQSPARRYVPLRLLSVDGVSQPDEKILNLSPFLQPGQSIKTQTLTLGKVVSNRYSPQLGSWIIWAHIHRDFFLPGQRIPLIDPTDQTTRPIAEVEVMDVSPSKESKIDFQKAMETGLTAYHKNDFTVAKEKFLQAIKLNPSHPDPWEALAVIEEKTGNIDEAIRLNKTFAEKNSDSPLANTNLSRLYMLKGWIEKAEDEKKKATVLMFKAAAREKKLQKEQIKPANPQAEVENKKRIFRQVLELDPEDEIAHFGLGKLLFEEKNYSEAEDHFRQTLKKNPSYSLAYSFLSQCLIHKGHKGRGRNGGSSGDHKQILKEAESMLKAGIQQAQEQGQMIPLKAMEEFLRQLSKGDESPI